MTPLEFINGLLWIGFQLLAALAGVVAVAVFFDSRDWKREFEESQAAKPEDPE